MAQSSQRFEPPQKPGRFTTGQRHRNHYDQTEDQLSPSAKVIRSEALDEGLVDEFRYQGRVTWVRDALGRLSAYQSDERQDIIAVRDALGHISHTPFDANGHPKGSVDPLGRSHTTCPPN